IWRKQPKCKKSRCVRGIKSERFPSPFLQLFCASAQSAQLSWRYRILADLEIANVFSNHLRRKLLPHCLFEVSASEYNSLPATTGLVLVRLNWLHTPYELQIRRLCRVDSRLCQSRV